MGARELPRVLRGRFPGLSAAGGPRKRPNPLTYGGTSFFLVPLLAKRDAAPYHSLTMKRGASEAPVNVPLIMKGIVSLEACILLIDEGEEQESYPGEREELARLMAEAEARIAAHLSA